MTTIYWVNTLRPIESETSWLGMALLILIFLAAMVFFVRGRK